MANTKANIKNIRKQAKQQARNVSANSALKTTVKNCKNNKGASLNDVYQKVDSLYAKGKISKNKANRIKSRTAIALNKIKNEKKK